ncbi:MAG: UDP-N-acetylmuramoyl-L-alanyl-D-glutamate--2,6-diaminopimelate ligase [Lachnospiraceae bacterium]|nr:UDP-N-acetylmuramoyl-L-alanyl-D-glutamate--2,6-diaminopimelate ligase [Lachnospiraceae bacterium]
MSLILSISEYEKALDNAGLLQKCLLKEKFSETVSLVTYDSREVVAGTLFICKGAAFKPEYLKSAIEDGAIAYVSEKEYEEGACVPAIIVSDIRKAMPVLGDLFYDYPQNKLKITAFGGTKGKSTSTYYMKSVIDEYLASEGKGESAVLSSIDNYDGVIREESHITTAESLELHKHMANAVASNIDFLEMEVSSQALKYDRVLGMRFAVSVFMNISEDHISPNEHADFEDYLSSKMKMFALTDTAAVNLDSDCIERILDEAKAAKSFVTFSCKDEGADYFAHDIRKDGESIFFKVTKKLSPSFDEDFELTMPGLFNVENALGVIAAADIYGIPVECIREGLRKAKSPGRMELFKSKDGLVNAFVDYAHNKLSFEALYSSVEKEFPGYDIVGIFGCPGGKAYQRRYELPQVAAKYADKIYICAEDPGPDPAEEISEEVAKYAKEAGIAYEEIEDRGAAIHKAILEVRRPTVLLITGKGEETRQKYGTVYAPCRSDADYTKEFIREYDESPHHARK